MKLRKAYSLIELLVAVSIVAIISTMVVVNYNNSRSRARDSNRRDNVSTYQKAIDQYYVNTGTYMVASAIKNVDYLDETQTGCKYTEALAKSEYNTDFTGTGNWQRLSFKLDGVGCGGYNGQGLGKMTRSGGAYGTQSIASTLKNEGYLNEIRTDPRAKTFTNDAEPDFVLTLCTKSFRQALSPAQAVNYAIFAALENEPKDQSETEKQKAEKYCGGQSTGKGWLANYADTLKIK